MTSDSTRNTQKEYQARMERLSRRETRALNPAYTRFVRAMRLLLPLAAVGIIAVLFTVSGMDEDAIVPVKPQDQKLPERIVKNELVNPKFASVDKKNQPYEIIAERAVQGEKNKDLIMLDKPVGTLTMKDGEKVKITSKTGAYRQDTERFFLEGDVSMEHSGGYSLQSEETHMDMKSHYAWSEKDVYGKGPDLELQAKGLKADGNTGQITFTGPARLVLTSGMDGFK